VPYKDPEAHNAWRKANKEKQAAYDKAWCEANKEKRTAYAKAWYETNKAERAAYDKARYEANREKRQAHYQANKERQAAYYQANKAERVATAKVWYEANRHIANATSARRRAAKQQATPAWANHEAIKEMYAEAAFLTEVLGVPYHVDHIVPLRSKIVCGLHCEQNLQAIEGVENIRKGNRHWPDMP
jgi:hypothetical protein